MRNSQQITCYNRAKSNCNFRCTTFVLPNPDCLEAFIVWLDSKNRGTWNKSLDIDPTQPSKVLRKDLYSTEEKRKLKPSEECQIMYLKSNEKAKNVSKYLKRQFNRHVKEVDYDGNCLFSAILVQISHHTTRYTADTLRKQLLIICQNIGS